MEIGCWNENLLDQGANSLRSFLLKIQQESISTAIPNQKDHKQPSPSLLFPVHLSSHLPGSSLYSLWLCDLQRPQKAMNRQWIPKKQEVESVTFENRALNVTLRGVTFAYPSQGNLFREAMSEAFRNLATARKPGQADTR